MADLDRFVIRGFVSDDGAEPKAVAMVWERKTWKGKPVLDMLPAAEFGETASDAENKLAAFLTSEIAKERRRSEVAAEWSERMRVRARNPKAAIHHLDGDPTNNDPANLRIVTKGAAS